ncbi:hypothetical protein MRX96_051280, partial [Rhipicephalus microplus]
SRWWHFSYFKRIGIPGPKPNLIWGNLAEYHSTDVYKIIGKWIKKYGDTFGFYDGDVPFIVTQDLDLIEEVCVRSFSNFTGRGMMPLVDEYIDGLLASMKDPACSGCEVNMVNTYKQLSMLVVGHVSFGVDCRAPESFGHSIVTVVRYVSHKIMAEPLHMIARELAT